MADIIRLLPDHVANQIAAGEVVQRPASVVKELLENAIDAQATSIKLIVKDGGKALIQVVDNGVGMSDTDARLSFERHATSKISSADDLFKLSTKGFRGEALASIAAIAHVEMQTRKADDELGTHLKIEGSKVVSQEVAAVAKGTSIAVKNLFFNIPARRNFLKSNQVEQRHIIDEFQRVALVHPEISFCLYHNGSELFNLQAENMRQRITHIFGNRMDERLVPVQEETDTVTISGFICKPEFAKKSRGEQFFFANDRFIKSAYLHHAVVAAFEGLLRPDTHPGYFLFLKVAPNTLDINIHPTKTEVKFDDEHTLYAMLRSTVKHSLGQFNIAPVLDFERDRNLDTPYGYHQKQAVMPSVEVDSGFNPFSPSPLPPKKDTKGWEALFVDNETSSGSNSFSSLQLESDIAPNEIFADTVGQSRPTFQLRRRYIVTTLKSGLLVVDQQRAHQRILYERFLNAIPERTAASQQLLFPVTLSFGTKQMETFAEMKQTLHDSGFVFDMAEEQVTVTGMPLGMAESVLGTVLEELIEGYQENGATSEGFSQNAFFGKTLCKAMGIKYGEVLAPEAQMVLIDDLFACGEPKLSPFNKVIHTTIGLHEIDKKFG